jgi:hypothetical protein
MPSHSGASIWSVTRAHAERPHGRQEIVGGAGRVGELLHFGADMHRP